MDDLVARLTDAEYEADILLWSEHQAALLRRAASGKQVADLDWGNIIEEIEALGRSELHAVESLLVQAIAHMLKIQAWPQSSEVPGWQGEVERFRQDAARSYTPSMRQRINIDKLHRQAKRILPPLIDRIEPRKLSPRWEYTLDEMLSENPLY